MKDQDDKKIKAEIDEIMNNVDNIMNKIEALNLIKPEEAGESED